MFCLTGCPSGAKTSKAIEIGQRSSRHFDGCCWARAFVACFADNYSAVIDLKTLEVTSHLDVGGVPDGMAWSVRQ